MPDSIHDQSIIADLKWPDDRRRNERALKEIQDSLYRYIWLFAYNILADKEAAEEILSDSFLKLWNRRNTFETMGQVKAWLFTASKNACIDELRRRKKHSQLHRELYYLAQNENYVENNLIDATFITLLFEEIERLPPSYKEVVKLTVIENLTTREIADRLGKSVDNVGQQKKKASQLIKNVLIRKRLLLFITLLISTFRI